MYFSNKKWYTIREAQASVNDIRFFLLKID